MNEQKLKQRILEISKKLQLSHIGSSLSCLPILIEIYEKKKANDIILMDNGHASLCQYVVLESLGGKDAEEMFHKHGVHGNRDIENGLDGSNGSLGHGLGIGIGYARANPFKTVYVIVSDGSMMEGSNWEALRILDQLNLLNIEIYCNFNGYTAVSRSLPRKLEARMKVFYNPNGYTINFKNTSNGEGFEGVAGHYKVL